MIDVIVVGGGIGGLSASIALRNAGYRTRVYERHPDFSELGVSLALAPNGMKAIAALGRGIYDAVIDRGMTVPTMAQLRIVDPAGRSLEEPPASIDLVGQFGHPQVTIRRNLLHDVLVAAHEGEGLEGGKRLVGLADDGDRVQARFGDGTDASGDLLVGADGLYSVVRGELHGAQEPHFFGWANLRGVSVGVPLPPEYPQGLQVRQGDEHVVVVPLGDGQHYVSSGWQVPEGSWPREPLVAFARVKERVRGWYAAEEIVGAIDPDTIATREMRDRLPIPAWTVGRCTLLGDAAHAMGNFWGQGGNSTLEDGIVLARCLSASADIASALQAYDASRIPRTTRLQEASANINSHLTDYEEFVDWLYGFDASAAPLAIADRRKQTGVR